MDTIISKIKDFLDEFAAAYKYAELDFYKLKTEVVELIDKAKTKGYGNPDYCEMSIKVVDRFETNVEIQVIYKNGDGKFYRFKKTLDVGKLTNVPSLVKNRLSANGEVAIKLSDFSNLYEIKETSITPTVEFKHLNTFTLKNAENTPVKKELHIKDNLFYYQVVLVYVYANGEKEIRNKYFGNILELPQPIIEKIASTPEHACFLDVTNN